MSIPGVVPKYSAIAGEVVKAHGGGHAKCLREGLITPAGEDLKIFFEFQITSEGLAWYLKNVKRPNTGAQHS